jgi:hypothetical protein
VAGAQHPGGRAAQARSAAPGTRVTPTPLATCHTRTHTHARTPLHQVKDNGLLCHQAVEQLAPLLRAEGGARDAPGALQWLQANGADMLEKPSMWIVVRACVCVWPRGFVCECVCVPGCTLYPCADAPPHARHCAQTPPTPSPWHAARRPAGRRRLGVRHWLWRAGPRAGVRRGRQHPGAGHGDVQQHGRPEGGVSWRGGCRLAACAAPPRSTAADTRHTPRRAERPPGHLAHRCRALPRASPRRWARW